MTTMHEHAASLDKILHNFETEEQIPCESYDTVTKSIQFELYKDGGCDVNTPSDGIT